jgi:phosphate transport system substrate-binding protein
MLPAIAAAVVMVYNIPGLGSTPIMFTRDVLPLIYMGEISMWNDSRIANANPDLVLPGQEIVIVGRSDGSGTTSVFTQALCLFSSAFNQSVGNVQLVNWGNSSAIAATAKGFIPNSRYKVRLSSSQGLVACARCSLTTVWATYITVGQG